MKKGKAIFQRSIGNENIFLCAKCSQIFFLKKPYPKKHLIYCDKCMAFLKIVEGVEDE